MEEAENTGNTYFPFLFITGHGQSAALVKYYLRLIKNQFS